MSYLDRNTLFLFLDESGNLDFSRTGSRYWSLTAFCTFHPASWKTEFLDLLYSLADDSQGQECFHAAEDKQVVRDSVFQLINGLTAFNEIQCVIAEKAKTNPSLYSKRRMKQGKFIKEKDESPFYRAVCKALLRYVFSCRQFGDAQKIVIILSSIFDKAKQGAIRGALAKELKEQAKVPFLIYFHSNKVDLNCQIADYCGWAIFRKWERQDERSYALIKHMVKNEFDMFARGTLRYY
jgi:hypothetical protein